MPTYEYSCGSCGHRFESFQSITAKPLKKCPECGRLTLSRLIGAGAGIIFHGAGFYETDYRSASYKEGQKKESSAPSSASSAPKAADACPTKGCNGKASSPAAKKT